MYQSQRSQRGIFWLFEAAYISKFFRLSLLFLIFFAFNSCKKELLITENQSTAKSKFKSISYQEFLKSVDLNSLGVLKSKLQSAGAKGKILSLNQSQELGNLAIYTDSVQQVTTADGISYIFEMALSSPRAITFRNFTIYVTSEQTSAFIATFTPTQEWIDAKKNKQPILFKGDVSFTPVNLNGVSLSQVLSADHSTGSNGKTMGVGNRTMVVETVCYSYQIMVAIPFPCSDGHSPEICPWSHGVPVPEGKHAGGYTMEEATQIDCFDMEMNPNFPGMDPPPGNGGGTIPTPPPDYDPCKGTTPSISYVKIEGGLKLAVAQTPPCEPGELYPLPPVPPSVPYELTAADIAILQEIAQEDAEADVVTLNNPNCYGTGRSGNVKWKGTAEHWLIQFDYVNTTPGALREYSIPGASVNGNRGYADIVNMTTGEIFEIKSGVGNGPDQGAVEVANYVFKANISCSTPSGVPFSKGISYPPKYFPHPYLAGKLLKAQLNGDGVIVYSTVESQESPQPMPVLLPENLGNKLRNFVRDLIEDGKNQEQKILVFLRNNPQIVPYLKAAAVGIVIGTILEDIATGGVGIADDWVSFLAARNLYRIALKL